MKKGAIGLLIILVYKLVGQINVPDSIFYQGRRESRGCVCRATGIEEIHEKI